MYGGTSVVLDCEDKFEDAYDKATTLNPLSVSVVNEERSAASPQKSGPTAAGPKRRAHCGSRTRLNPEYKLNRFSRKKPINVEPYSRASSTERLDGAPTAAMNGIPAEIDF